MDEYNVLNMVDFISKDIRFSPTGSRYWNYIDKVEVPVTFDTDYDFVAEFSEELEKEFIDKGFTYRVGNQKKTITASKDAKYRDGSTVIVLYYGSIQLILKKNVCIYLKVQRNIDVMFYKNYLWKKYSSIPDIQILLNTLCSIEEYRK